MKGKVRARMLRMKRTWWNIDHYGNRPDPDEIPEDVLRLPLALVQGFYDTVASILSVREPKDMLRMVHRLRSKKKGRCRVLRNPRR